MFSGYQGKNECEDNYGKLLEAIDFFSQSLHLEQLSYYGFEMVHQILNLDKSCLFIREKNQYELKLQKNYGIDQWTIPETHRLRQVATLFGRIMTSEQQDYFSAPDLEKFSAAIVIPLIIKDQMVGFIFSNGRVAGDFTAERLILAGALMQLMNRAYENATNFLELESKNYELDKKIFNLFFINHCSRTLLSELNLDKIYGICIDIIRELTSSSVTSFGLYDETRDRILIKGYQDILTFKSFYGEFQLKKDAPIPQRIVYHVERDRDELARFFEDVESLRQLKAEYLVMLVKDHILGFVSIGAPVSDRVYDATLFELIETIATSIYISVVNAQFFERINQQNESIRKKYETMQRFNRIIRNINSCESLDELCGIAMQSLEVGYGVKKAFLCIYREGRLEVMGAIGMPHINGIAITTGPGLEELKEKGICYEYSSTNIQMYFPEYEPERHGDSNCLIVAPISIDRMALGENSTLGYFVVFETESALKEEEILLLETLSNSVAPIIYQMKETTRILSRYTEDSEQLLLEAVEEKLRSREQYYIDFRIWYAAIPRIPFEKPDLSRFSEYTGFLVGDLYLCPLEDDIEAIGFDGEFVIEDISDFLDKVKLL